MEVFGIVTTYLRNVAKLVKTYIVDLIDATKFLSTYGIRNVFRDYRKLHMTSDSYVNDIHRVITGWLSYKVVKVIRVQLT